MRTELWWNDNGIGATSIYVKCSGLNPRLWCENVWDMTRPNTKQPSGNIAHSYTAFFSFIRAQHINFST